MANEYKFEITWKVGVKFDGAGNEVEEVETVSPTDEATVKVDVKLICDQDCMAQAVTLCLDLSGLSLDGEAEVERDRVALQKSVIEGEVDEEHRSESYIDATFEEYGDTFAIAGKEGKVEYELGEFANGQTKTGFFVLLTGKSVGVNAHEGNYTIPAYVTFVPTSPIKVDTKSLPFKVTD